MRKMWVIPISIFLILGVFFAGCTEKTETGETSTTPTTTETGESSTSTTTTPAAKETVIKIGVLTDLSGPLTSDGNDIKKTLEIGKDEINKYFKEKGLPYKVELYVEDTQTNPSICLQKVQSLKARGINLIIGPMSSSEVKNIKNYVTSNKMVIISPSSTAIPIMIGFTKPEDKKYVFRFVPNDEFQGKAIAGEIKDMGIKEVVVLYRGDAWGKGLEKAAVENLKKEGINIIDEIEYPSTPEPSDWSPYIQKIRK